MNRETLDSLKGLTTKEAEAIVLSSGLKPDANYYKAFRPAITLPPNVVMLNYNEDGKIVSAETQESIDEKYR